MAWDKLLPFLRKHAKKVEDYISETFDRVRTLTGKINLPQGSSDDPVVISKVFSDDEDSTHFDDPLE